MERRSTATEVKSAVASGSSVDDASDAHGADGASDGETSYPSNPARLDEKLRLPSTEAGFTAHRRGLLARAAALAIGTLAGAPALARREAEATSAATFPFALAHRWREGDSPQGWAVSEKFDGVRAGWDGRALRTRGGLPIAAPAWFVAGLPREALDGELWTVRGGFERTVSTVRQQTPDDAAWRGIRFQVFDAPMTAGPFRDRDARLTAIVSAAGQPWLLRVAQSDVATVPALDALLARTIAGGGEGLMLRRWDSLHRAGRTRDLLKLKTADDADARVTGHEPGRGKFEGMTGALRVETADGVRFKIGTGLSDAERRAPPPIGTWVTYRFRGETDAGVPRFASLVRIGRGG